MIKVEKGDIIHYFKNREDFGDWLVDCGYARNFRDFADEEYSVWEILSVGYTHEDIFEHWRESEIYDTINEWIERGDAEEI